MMEEKKIILTGAPLSVNQLYRHTCKKGFPLVYMTAEAKTIKEQWQWEAKLQ